MEKLDFQFPLMLKVNAFCGNETLSVDSLLYQENWKGKDDSETFSPNNQNIGMYSWSRVRDLNPYLYMGHGKRKHPKVLRPPRPFIIPECPGRRAKGGCTCRGREGRQGLRNRWCMMYIISSSSSQYLVFTGMSIPRKNLII